MACYSGVIVDLLTFMFNKDKIDEKWHCREIILPVDHFPSIVHSQTDCSNKKHYGKKYPPEVVSLVLTRRFS